MNSVNIIGNMTRDIEIKVVSENFSVGKFGIAVNKRIKKNGEYVDKAMFFDVTAMNGTAQNIAKYFSKGSRIGITGELDFDSWENEKGKQSRVSIFCKDFSFVDRKSDSTAPSAPRATPQPTSNIPDFDVDSSDIPF